MNTREPTQEELRFHCFIGKINKFDRDFVYNLIKHFWHHEINEDDLYISDFGTGRFVEEECSSSIRSMVLSLRACIKSVYDCFTEFFYIDQPEIDMYTSDHGVLIEEFRKLIAFNKDKKQFYVWIFSNQPLIVNEFEANEITLITHARTGLKYHLLESLPGWDNAKKVYQPGEFWVSYSDGTEEEKYLLQGLPRP